MKAFPLSACLYAAIACTGCTSATIAEGPRYGVCRTEVIDFVEQRLGQTVTRVDIQAYAERSIPFLFDVGNALAYVKECDGFHSFQIRGTWSECEHLAHYGHSRSYIRYEGPFEGCKTG